MMLKEKLSFKLTLKKKYQLVTIIYHHLITSYQLVTPQDNRPLPIDWMKFLG